MSTYLIQEIAASNHFEHIHKVMQAAYTAEAQLLGVDNFYPLKRTASDIASSSNHFVGCFRQGELVGVCELQSISEIWTLVNEITSMSEPANEVC